MRLRSRSSSKRENPKPDSSPEAGDVGRNKLSFSSDNLPVSSPERDVEDKLSKGEKMECDDDTGSDSAGSEFDGRKCKNLKSLKEDNAHIKEKRLAASLDCTGTVDMFSSSQERGVQEDKGNSELGIDHSDIVTKQTKESETFISNTGDAVVIQEIESSIVLQNGVTSVSDPYEKNEDDNDNINSGEVVKDADGGVCMNPSAGHEFTTSGGIKEKKPSLLPISCDSLLADHIDSVGAVGPVENRSKHRQVKLERTRINIENSEKKGKLNSDADKMDHSSLVIRDVKPAQESVSKGALSMKNVTDGQLGVSMGKRGRGRPRKKMRDGDCSNENKSTMPLQVQDSDISDTKIHVEEESCESQSVACDEDADVDSNTDSDDGKIRRGKTKGRKRKKMGSPRCSEARRTKTKKVHKGIAHVTSRVLRSSVMATTTNNKVFKVEALRLDQNEQTVVSKNETRRGRPPNVKHHGRPPKKEKVEEEFDEKNTQTTSDHLKSKGVAKGRKFEKSMKKDIDGEGICDNKLNIRGRFQGNNDKMKAGGVSKVQKAGNLVAGSNLEKNKAHGNEGQSRSMEKQGVRDQIVAMLIKAGWTIEYRPRQGRSYLDAIYVEPNGKPAHWSVTKAYWSIEKKVEDKVADAKEVQAFTPISREVLSALFRKTSTVRCDKNVSRKMKTGSKTGKKIQDTANTKKLNTKISSACKLSSSNMKVKGEKSSSLNIKVKGAKSSYRGRPRINQEERQSRKPRLLPRNSEKGSDVDNEGLTLSSSKRNLLSWMIGMGTILPGMKLHFGNGKRKRTRFHGTITADGIHCGCCNEIISLSEFGAHAGSKLHHPFGNLYLESGETLMKCLVDSWKKEEKSNCIRFNRVDVDGEDPNDDTCNICGDGGDLVCCDGCPSTFHQSCLDIDDFPSGDWYCVYCSCKFCGMVVANTPQTDDFDESVDSDMLSCCLCEEKFHQQCVQSMDAVDIGSDGPFCGRKCQELFDSLQKYIGVKHQLEEGFSWTLLQRSDSSQDLPLSGDPLKIECNSKLAVAFSVMDECFVPIIDEKSGVNMIHNVVYNCRSNFKRLNYGGFYTIILERGDEMISAASLRFHGNQLAEMPFIGTRHMYRRQGMCRRLLNAIEWALGSLDVEKLVIPAISELFETWTSVFAFQPLEESKRQEMKCMSIIVFPGTDMLVKPVLKNQASVGHILLAADATNTEQTVMDDSGDAKEAINCDQPSEVTVSPAREHIGTKAERSVVCHGLEATNVMPRDANPETQPLNTPSDLANYPTSSHPRSNDGSIDSNDKNPNEVDQNTSSLCGFPQSRVHQVSEKHSLSESCVDNDANLAVKSFSLTSGEKGPERASGTAEKFLFDLNEDITGSHIDFHTIGEDSAPHEPQHSTKTVEPSQTRSHTDSSGTSICDSDPCTNQSLVLV